MGLEQYIVFMVQNLGNTSGAMIIIFCLVDVDGFDTCTKASSREVLRELLSMFFSSQRSRYFFTLFLILARNNEQKTNTNLKWNLEKPTKT